MKFAFPRASWALNITCGAALSLCAALAHAHDTWFELRPSNPPEVRSMVLGTGTTYPLFDSGIDAKYLVKNACLSSAAQGDTLPLTPQGNEAPLLLLQLNTKSEARTCWAELAPFDIDLPADKIPIYLKEIGASPALRAVWAGIAKRGLPWRESYTKHARIELGVPSDKPAPMDFDLLLEGVTRPLQVGDTLRFRVLRDGKPLANQPIELRNDQLPFGIWRLTDAEGRAQVQAPAAGHWLLRGVDLRVSTLRPDSWVSRFITLAFDVAPKAP